MSRDLEIIRKIEEQNGKKLEQKSLGQLHDYRENGFAIDDQDHVVGLNLNNIGITDLTVLQSLCNFTELNVGRNRLTDVNSLAGLINLTHLDLRDNELTDVSPLSGLINLTHLDLRDNELTDVNPLSGLSRLTVLDLSKNELIDVNPLSGLSNLTELNLSYNELTDVKPLEGLSSLVELDLRGNQLTDVKLLGKLRNLKKLVLDDNRLTEVKPLKGLIKLCELSIGNNELTDVKPLEGLFNLESLWLNSINLTDLKPLKGLINLSTLYLGGNELTDVKPLEGLAKLKFLWLNYNKLTDVKPLIGLVNLTYLNLSDNKLSDMNLLLRLELLKTLNLIGNKLKELPKEIIYRDMKIDVDDKDSILKRDGLFLYGNPIEKPPLEIIRQGKEAMLAWFKSQEEEKKALNEVKVILVGEGGAGKTSLTKCLLGEDFDANESQTHGINIKPWKITVNGVEIVARMWDFGGQEIMHATHQFFLSKRSLYILVLDGRKDEKTEYWLKHIETFGSESPILIVMNKIDENHGFDVNRTFLKEKYKNIKGFFRLSCSDQSGIEEFICAVGQELSRVEMLQTTWGMSWFNVKTALEKMTDHYISFQQYKEICLKESIDESVSQETLVEFLHDLGVVLHFKEFDLRDTHVLHPAWATQAVYKIINSKELADSNGVLDIQQLDTILAQKDEKDFYYPLNKYRYIITLMKKFELCYSIDDERVLVPDLLPVQESSIEFEYESALAFIIQYDFLPPSVMPRFIVNMHKDIKNDYRWRTGVVLEDKDFHSTAIVKADQEARRIYIYVSGKQRRDYFAVILAALRRINSSFEKLKTTELIPMPDDPQITANYRQLIQFEEKGIEFYFTGENSKEYKVKELLGRIATPDTTQDEILKILKKLVNENDTEESAAKKLSDAFLFHPKILGLEIDVNKLIQMALPNRKKKA